MPSNLAPAAAEARLLHILDKSTFGQADRVAARDDDVILFRLAGPFTRPCVRPTPASQAREPDSPSGLSSVATSLWQ